MMLRDTFLTMEDLDCRNICELRNLQCSRQYSTIYYSKLKVSPCIAELWTSVWNKGGCADKM